MNLNAMLLADFYKLSHRRMYPKDTTKVYATWTPRGCRVAGCDEFVWFALLNKIEGITKEQRKSLAIQFVSARDALQETFKSRLSEIPDINDEVQVAEGYKKRSKKVAQKFLEVAALLPEDKKRKPKTKKKPTKVRRR